MQPLRITLALNRPLVVPDDPIHLDALLAWAAVDQATQEGRDDPLAAQEALPLRREGEGVDAVWCASQLLYTPLDTPQRMLMTKRFELMDFARAKGKVYDGGPNKFTPGTGPYKSFVLNVPLVWTERVVAYCIGDPEAVAALLARVHSVGKYARMNMGAITQRTVAVDARAETGWRYRTMSTPEADFAPVEATTRPPYWRREQRRLAYRPLTIPEDLLHD